MKPILLFLFFSLLSSAAYSQNFKIMTYNIRMDTEADGENAWSKRKEFFLRQIRDNDPEIIGFQEVTPGQLEFLSAHLKSYHYVGKGRDENNLGESSNIFYQKDRFELLDEATFWLSETPDQVSKGWDAACNRVCTYVLLKDKLSNQTFYVFNTHLDHMGEKAKTQGLELIVSKMQSINENKHPTFLIGDLNTEPHNERIRWLSRMMIHTRSISLKPYDGPLSTFNGFVFNNPTSKEIDYIFMSQDQMFDILEYRVIIDSHKDRYPSDHFPVMVKVKPKAK